MAVLDGPRVAPASGGAAKKLIIFAHGYGSNGQDLIGLASHLARVMPDAAFAAPNAPSPVPGYPDGHQWFALANLDPVKMSAGVVQAAPKLDGFIDAELERLHLPPKACALVGFSQGTMMSLHVGLRRPEPLGAVVGLSGLLTGPQTLAKELRSRPPVLLVHGDRDDRVPVQALFAALDGLASAAVPALWRISPGAGHTIAEDGLELAAVFLRDALSGRFGGWSSPQSRP